VAARRLLILMLAVLAVSTLAAALLAPPPSPEPAPTTTEDADPRDGIPHAGSRRLVKAALSPSMRPPARIKVRRGDQLALTVRARAAGQVEIPAFGLIEDVGPDDPARFDLLSDRLGIFEVRLAGSGRVIGRIAVASPRSTRPR
jgi:hypothetical protein